MKRGEIYYIESTYRETGSEQRGGRPAVIVSNDKNNENSEVVEVVYRIVQQDPDVEKIKLETERDLYRNLYNELLSKTMKGASA